MQRVLQVILIAVGVSAAGCARINPMMSGNGHAGTERRVRFDMIVTSEWLGEQLDRSDLAVIHVGFSPKASDAADRPTYGDGHIPGARHLKWEDIAVTRNGLPNEFPPLERLTDAFRRLGIEEGDSIVLYDTGAGVEAARAYVALEYVGVGGNAALLDGQFHGWLADWRPVTRVAPEIKPSHFVPSPSPEIIVDRQAMKDLVWAAGEPFSRVAVIDARSPEEFRGTEPGKGVTRAGHIPGAASVHWIRNVESREDPFLVPVEHLIRMYESAGVRPWSTVVAYCRTGVKASHTYFVCKFLGYRVCLYDGSYIDWTADPDLEVETSVHVR